MRYARCLKVLGITLALGLLVGRSANAQAPCKIEKHYRINTATLVLALAPSIPGITEDEVEYWVRYAVQQVVVQSGANLSIIYDGRTTALPGCQGVGSSDGIAQIGARNIDAVGWTNGEDICIGSSWTWSISEAPPWTRRDRSDRDFDARGHALGRAQLADGRLPPGVACENDGHLENTTIGRLCRSRNHHATHAHRDRHPKTSTTRQLLHCGLCAGSAEAHVCEAQPLDAVTMAEQFDADPFNAGRSPTSPWALLQEARPGSSPPSHRP